MQREALLVLLRCRVAYALVIHLSFLFFGVVCFCPNVCLASLFSLAIHCLTAEVFFQPFKPCTLKFPGKGNQVRILVYVAVMSLCTLSSRLSSCSVTPRSFINA